MHFNKVILAGNLTRDPQVRYTGNGTAVCDIGLAVNRKVKEREETTFVDVTLWARTAEVAGEYLSKGSKVLVEGRLQLDQWTDKQTGKKRSKLKVVSENMQMLGGRSDTSGESSNYEQMKAQEQEQAATASAGAAPPDDEVPF